MDERLFHLFYGARAGAFTSLAAVFTLLGDGWVTLALLPLLFIRRHRAAAVALIGALSVNAVAVSLLKVAVRRVRPCHALAGVRCLFGDAPTDFSFPSGHAAGSFAFAAFVVTVALVHARTTGGEKRGRLVACVAMLAGAACVALSRVYLGVHFPGDVAAGSFLGAGIGTVGALGYLRSGRRAGVGVPSPRATSRSLETRS